MRESLKKYIVISNKWIQHNKKYWKFIQKNAKEYKIIILQKIYLSKEIIKQMIQYSGFTGVINKTKIKELEDYTFNEAVDKIYYNQLKYLSIPFYYLYNKNLNELVHLEMGLVNLKERLGEIN